MMCFFMAIMQFYKCTSFERLLQIKIALTPVKKNQYKQKYFFPRLFANTKIRV